MTDDAVEDEGMGTDSSASTPAREELPQELLHLLPQRDERALGAFFDLYFDRVYGYLRRLLGEDHLAEDLSQDVFLHVYRSLPSYDPSRDLRPWVFTIATNKVRDYWRSRRHHDAQRERSAETEDALDHLGDSGERPDSELTREERDARVRKAIDRLPEGMRTTVLLRVYEDLSFEAIGAMLGRNEVAVRKRYSRALELLRGTLGTEYRVHQEGG